MKKLLLLFTLFFTAFFTYAQVEKVIPGRPSPPRLVNDYTQTLTNEQQGALESKLDAYDRATSNQIAVVIVDDLKGYSPVEYAVALGRKWGVGGKDYNNGVVILVAMGSNQVFIATGYGLEGAVPDITAKSIIDNNIVPNFRNGNFYRGLDEAVDQIIKAAAGEYQAPEGYGKKNSKGKGIAGIILVIMIILFSIIGRSGRGGGGMASRRGWGGFGTGWIIGSMLGGMSSGRGGGGWSGGGGGGFGGFGGGGFGGGEAGGRW